MGRKVTLLQLRTQSRQRADQENSGFIKDPELNSYINNSIAELYDLLISAYGEGYFEADPFRIVTQANVEKYELPDDFYKLLGVDLVLSNSDRLTLRKYEFNKRNYYTNATSFSLTADENIKYRLRGSNISFIPAQIGVKNIDLIYVPNAPLLEVNSDEFDGFNGWEEYVIIDAAIKMRVKEETSINELVMQKNSILERINKIRQNRDIGDRKSVV